MNTSRPSRTIDDRGYTYHFPLLGFDDHCPIELPGATDWERQEIDRHWRDAMRSVQTMHDAAAHWTEHLTHPDPGAYGLGTADIHGSGGRLTIDAGTRAAQALLALHHVHNGYRHRIATRNTNQPTDLLELAVTIVDIVEHAPPDADQEAVNAVHDALHTHLA